MKYSILIFFFLCSFCFGAQTTKKVIAKKDPNVVTVEVQKGSKIRTPQEDLELRDWIIGIQNISRDAITKADAAEKEAAESRTNLDAAETSLKEALTNADSLQKAINAQTQQLNESIIKNQKLETKVQKLTKKNNLLATLLGLIAAAGTVFLALWLRIPNLSPPWGLVATIGAPVIVFGLIKLIL